MVSRKLTAFLDEHAARYVSIRHSPAYTAPEVAASAHVSGRDFAKTVIVKLDGQPVMLVVPAHRRVALPELREILDSHDVAIATEAELRLLFPDCEVGAMPPVGNLYGLQTYVDASLVHEEEIAFNAGTHTDVIKMPYEDFDRVVRPMIIDYVTR